MKLYEYMEKLEKFIKENPKALQYEVVSSIDDEGNGYNRVHCGPSKGHYDDEEFHQEVESNSVCIN